MRAFICVFINLYAFAPVLAAGPRSSTATTTQPATKTKAITSSHTTTPPSTASRATPAANIPALPPTSDVTINRISTSGLGCLGSEVSISLNTNRTLVTLGFDDFDVYVGPGTNASQHSKSCIIHLAVRYPSGYTFDILDATYHGFAQLDAGVTGTFDSIYQLVDSTTALALANLANSTTAVTLEGGGNYTNGEVYTVDTQIPTLERVRAPCGQVVDLLVCIGVGLSSTDPNAAGELTGDDATYSFGQEFHFGWQNCSSTS